MDNLPLSKLDNISIISSNSFTYSDRESFLSNNIFNNLYIPSTLFNPNIEINEENMTKNLTHFFKEEKKRDDTSDSSDKNIDNLININNKESKQNLEKIISSKNMSLISKTTNSKNQSSNRNFKTIFKVIDDKLIIPNNDNLNQKIKKKRGRMTKNEKKLIYLIDCHKIKNFKNINKIHNRDSFDNLLRKIKVIFQKYLIELCNKSIKFYFKRQIFIFRKISSVRTQNININYNRQLLNNTIEDFLSQSISDKYKAQNSNQNKKNLYKIKDKEFFKPLISLKLKDLYSYMFIEKENILGLKYSQLINSVESFEETVLKMKNNGVNENYLNILVDVGKRRFIKYFLGPNTPKIKDVKLNEEIQK